MILKTFCYNPLWSTAFEPLLRVLSTWLHFSSCNYYFNEILFLNFIIEILSNTDPCRADNMTGGWTVPNCPCYYRPHSKDEEGNIFSLFTTEGGVSQSQVLFLVSGHRSFPGGYPSPGWGGVSQDRGTPQPGLGYPPPEQVMLQAACLVRFPVGGLSCITLFQVCT